MARVIMDGKTIKITSGFKVRLLGKDVIVLKKDGYKVQVKKDENKNSIIIKDEPKSINIALIDATNNYTLIVYNYRFATSYDSFKNAMQVMYNGYEIPTGSVKSKLTLPTEEQITTSIKNNEESLTVSFTVTKSNETNVTIHLAKQSFGRYNSYTDYIKNKPDSVQEVEEDTYTHAFSTNDYVTILKFFKEGQGCYCYEMFVKYGVAPYYDENYIVQQIMAGVRDIYVEATYSDQISTGNLEEQIKDFGFSDSTFNRTFRQNDLGKKFQLYQIESLSPIKKTLLENEYALSVYDKTSSIVGDFSFSQEFALASSGTADGAIYAVTVVKEGNIIKAGRVIPVKDVANINLEYVNRGDYGNRSNAYLFIPIGGTDDILEDYQKRTIKANGNTYDIFNVKITVAYDTPSGKQTEKQQFYFVWKQIDVSEDSWVTPEAWVYHTRVS